MSIENINLNTQDATRKPRNTPFHPVFQTGKYRVGLFQPRTAESQRVLLSFPKYFKIAASSAWNL